MTKIESNLTGKRLFTILSVTAILGSISGYEMTKLISSVEDKSYVYPSTLSTNYLDIVGDNIIDEESSFKVLGVDQLNVSLESDFIKSIQEFSELYVNTLKSDKPEFNFEDYILKKDDETYSGLSLDLEENEFLYFIDKSNFEILEKEEGFLTPDGNSAALKIIFQFTVDKITKPDKYVTKLLKVGETYTQLRELHFKKTSTGDYKIYEQYIGAIETIDEYNKSTENKKGTL